MLCLNHYGLGINKSSCTEVWDRAFKEPTEGSISVDGAVVGLVPDAHSEGSDGEDSVPQQILEELAGAKRPMKKICTEKCSRKCTVNFSSDDRAKNNEEFWKKTPTERMNFIADTVAQKETERKTKGKLGETRRAFTNEYHFKKASEQGGGLHRVCKVFYLGTLGFSSNNTSVVLNALNKRMEVSSIENVQDMRGRHAPKHKMAVETRGLIIQHIQSFRPMSHHYRRAHAPYRRYLPCELSITGLHNDFRKKNADVAVGYSSYARVFHKGNISFAKLANEECDVCLAQDNHIVVAHPLRQPEPVSCEQCGAHAKHVAAFVQAREWYIQDRTRELEPSELVVSADMEKVIVLPIIPGSKACIFTPRLIAFNETFANVNDNAPEKKTLAVLWHEGTTGRNSSDVASAFFAFLRVSVTTVSI